MIQKQSTSLFTSWCVRYELLAGDLGDVAGSPFQGKAFKSGPVTIEQACRSQRRFLGWAYGSVEPCGEELKSIIPGWKDVDVRPLAPMGRSWRVSVEPYYQVMMA